jgi:sporulation protein YlmC with PRC-barrel domain
MAQSGGMQGQFMTQMQPNQMMASKLIGTNVISANNESIGDVNDVILDRDGQVMAVVVGVGGFLGIGEKDVAVPLKSLEFATREQVNAMNSNANSGSTTSGTTSTMSNNSVNTTGSTTGGTATNRSTATTGNTGNSGTSSAANSGSNANEPERVVLRMTKAELQAAPTFQTSSRSGNNAGSAGSSTTGTTTAPKQ